MGGRSCRFVFELDDKPGQMSGIVKIIADLGGNVISVEHSRSREDVDITACQMSIRIETRNHEHIQQIRDALTQAGFRMV
jgi:threonine dehydratase